MTSDRLNFHNKNREIMQMHGFAVLFYSPNDAK